jgi:HSP20 family protein
MLNLIPRRARNEVSLFKNELDDLFGRFFENDVPSNLPAAFTRNVIPPVDVAETEKNWTVSVQLPGLSEKDIAVQILGNQLVVSGERKWEDEKKGKEFHRVESQYGSFQRSIALPENARLDPDSIAASYKKGILEITIPKVEPTPAAKIPVKAG